MFEFVSLSPPVADVKPKVDGNIKLEPGVQMPDPLTNTSAVQARLITFDHETNILADPGWDGLADLGFLESVVPKIDLIILSQATVEYLGAFAYLLYKYPILKRIKTYATLPIAKMGRIATIELYRSVGLIGAVQGSTMDAEDIEKYFNSIIPLNYAQSINLQGKLAGITITAYNSGHTLGGSVWLFNKEAEKVIYAPVWNHSKDLFLKPCKLLNQSTLARPTTFVTGSDLGSSASHKKRIDSFLKLVQMTLYNQTSILIPTSLTGRFFEILPLLDQKISQDIPFFLVAYTGIQSLKSSLNMLEWMSPDITKDWETQNRTPFDSTRIELIKVKDLMSSRGPRGPKIVFVESLDFGEGSLARPTFIELCSRQNTALLLTERPNPGTLLYDVYKQWETTVEKDNNLKDGSLIILKKDMTLKYVEEKPMRGQELNTYLKGVDERIESRQKLEEEEKKNENLLEEGEDEDEDDDEDNEDEDGEKSDEEEKEGEKLSSLVKSTRKDEDVRYTAKQLLEMPMDFDIRDVKSNKNKMFPFMVDRFTVDDYGIQINHDDFKREEEKFSLKRDFEDGDDGQGINDRKRRRVDNQPQFRNRQKQREKVTTLYKMDPKLDPVTRSTRSKKVSIRCGVSFVDLSGVADMRSWKFNANGLKPRKVIILPNVGYSGYLGGGLNIMESLAKQRHNLLTSGFDNFHSQSSSGVLGVDYLRGKLNEKIELGNVISSYSLQIDDQLDKELEWQVITGGYSLAHISGEVTKMGGDEGEGRKNMFKLVPSNKSIKATNSKISIGDIKLNELRKRLRDQNHIVEFKGDGTLVVDNQLAVRKINDGNLVVDGGMGELFYKVRGEIQKMLAYV